MPSVIITIDGTVYAVSALQLDEISEFADKYAERTEDWDLQRELAGIFYNYELTIGDLTDQITAQALYEKIHEFTPYHTVTLPHGAGTQTFTAYVTGTTRTLRRIRGGANAWGGFKIRFVAKAPQVTG